MCKLTKIEKGKLLAHLSPLTTGPEMQNLPLSKVKDKRLIQMLQGNSSVVLDKNGEPFVVYHASDADINVFRTPAESTQFANPNMDCIEWIYFPKDPNYSEIWDVTNDTPSIYPVYLNIKNPYTKLKDTDELADAVDFGYGLSAKQLLSKGYDGLYLEDEGIWTAFDPNQIKSATGNTGAFSPKTDGLRFQLNPDEIEQRHVCWG